MPQVRRNWPETGIGGILKKYLVQRLLTFAAHSRADGLDEDAELADEATAEIDRLTAERDDLTRKWASNLERERGFIIERDALRAEVSRWTAEAQRFALNADYWRAEVERLRAERGTFYMDYRMKCDEQTKALHVEVERLRAALEPLARIPVEEFGAETRLEQPLMGWNSHTIYVRDVMRARTALAPGEGL